MNTIPETVAELREAYGPHLAPGYSANDSVAKVLANAGVSTVEKYLAQTTKH